MNGASTICSIIWNKRPLRFAPPPGSTGKPEENEMTGTMAAGEFSRNARLLLRLMGKTDARLVEAGAGKWVIESGRNRRRSRQTVADEMVRELAARECLIREPAGGAGLSALPSTRRKAR
jgi:hypothetical protein